MLTDTCGAKTAPLQITSGAGAFTSWVSSPQLAGGVYRLCWCSGDTGGTGAQSCYDAEDFQTDAGSLTVIGVAPLQQEKTCISGLPCQIDGITGIHTSGSDRFLVLQTCGTNSIVEGFQGFQQMTQTSSSLRPWNLLSSISWRQIRAAGGQYALCWCHSSQSPLANHEKHQQHHKITQLIESRAKSQCPGMWENYRSFSARFPTNA